MRVFCDPGARPSSALSRAFPSWWPAIAAPGAALLVLVLGFVAPRRARAALQPLRAARGRAARRRSRRARGPRGRARAGRARRRREPAHAQGERVRLRDRRDAARRALRHAAARGAAARARGRRRPRARPPARAATSPRARRSRCSAPSPGRSSSGRCCPDPQDPAIAPKLLLITAVLELLALPVRGGALAALGARRRPLLARGDRRSRRVPGRPPRPRAREPRRSASRRGSPTCCSSATRRRPSGSRPPAEPGAGRGRRTVLQSKRDAERRPHGAPAPRSSSPFSSSGRPRSPRSARSLGRRRASSRTRSRAPASRTRSTASATFAAR